LPFSRLLLSFSPFSLGLGSPSGVTRVFLKVGAVFRVCHLGLAGRFFLRSFCVSSLFRISLFSEGFLSIFNLFAPSAIVNQERTSPFPNFFFYPSTLFFFLMIDCCFLIIHDLFLTRFFLVLPRVSFALKALGLPDFLAGQMRYSPPSFCRLRKLFQCQPGRFPQVKTTNSSGSDFFLSGLLFFLG